MSARVLGKKLFQDNEHFHRLFKENYSALCHFAVALIKNTAEAEDIVQNSFVKMWENQDRIQIEISPKAYIYRAVKNACLNQIKHKKIREQYQLHVQNSDEINVKETEIEKNELIIRINESIEKMPKQRQAIFKMSRFEGLKYKEIAEKLSISSKTVENHMGLAMKFLKEELKDYLNIVMVVSIIEGLGDYWF